VSHHFFAKVYKPEIKKFELKYITTDILFSRKKHIMGRDMNYETVCEYKKVYHRKPLALPLSALRDIEEKLERGVPRRQIGRDHGINYQRIDNLMRKWKAGKNPPAPEPEGTEEAGGAAGQPTPEARAEGPEPKRGEQAPPATMATTEGDVSPEEMEEYLSAVLGETAKNEAQGS